MLREHLPLEEMRSRVSYWTSLLTSRLSADLMPEDVSNAQRRLRLTVGRLEQLDVKVDRPGRAGRGDGYYALWAWRAQQARSGGSRSPNQDVAEQYLGTREEWTRIRDLLHEARRRHLYSKSGELTSKGRAALDNYKGEANGLDS